MKKKSFSNYKIFSNFFFGFQHTPNNRFYGTRNILWYSKKVQCSWRWQRNFGRLALGSRFGLTLKNRNNWNELQVICGGTLIKENYVLTAAHCFSAGEDNPTLVRFGDLDITTDTDGANHEDIKIQRAIVHPG